MILAKISESSLSKFKSIVGEDLPAIERPNFNAGNRSLRRLWLALQLLVPFLSGNLRVTQSNA